MVVIYKQYDNLKVSGRTSFTDETGPRQAPECFTVSDTDGFGRVNWGWDTQV